MMMASTIRKIPRDCRPRSRKGRELDLDNGNADHPIGGAQFARVVDDFGHDLRQAKSDEGEIHTANPVGDQAADCGSNERRKTCGSHGQPEGGNSHQCQGRDIGADAKIKRLPQRQRARIAEEKVN